jgi:hypothetical protein
VAQVIALEKAQTEEAHGEFEREHPDYCGTPQESVSFR